MIILKMNLTAQFGASGFHTCINAVQQNSKKTFVIPVGCPNVTTAIDGNFNLVTDGTVTSVNFQCDNGATIDGTPTLTCQSDGTWTSVQPTCGE